MTRAEGRRGPGRPSSSFPPTQRNLMIGEWPDQDRAAWEAAFEVRHPLRQPGAGAHLAQATRLSYRQAWGRFLSYLRAADMLDPSAEPQGRLTPFAIDGFTASLTTQVSASTAKQIIVKLRYVADILAPGGEWGWIMQSRLLPRASDVRASHKPIQPPDPAHILTLALDEADAADGDQLSITSAKRYRDAVLLALAVMTGLRRKNLAEMEIGRHLLVHDARMRLAFHDSLKNKAVFDCPVPDLLQPYIRTWLERHRPVLLQGHPPTNALWLGQSGKPLRETAVRQIFARMGQRLVGSELTPQHFRHALATHFTEQDPRLAPIASAALAHHGTSSVNRTYDRSGNAAASAIFEAARDRRLRDARERLAQWAEEGTEVAG